ncbi:unnamed protein product [Mycena citricolor]|uniref:F-box domain-containing protein n=1 Tax=Mycena citricolor TaxID=2018698 RepID=A0AAD2GYC2_9AGAR|nr:unnamed protein product [Mycena citricolor]
MTSLFSLSPRALRDLLLAFFRPTNIDDTSRPVQRLPPAYSRTPRLPLELVLCIMEDASDGEGFEHAALLRQCALVCRDWSLPAQKLLFRTVHLVTEDACASFLSAVHPRTAAGRVLGESVTQLRVVLDYNQPKGLSETSFAHAVCACPNLLSLDLSVYGSTFPGKESTGVADVLRVRRSSPSFEEKTLECLKAGPRIRALQLSNWSENHESVLRLFEVWPELISLALSGSTPTDAPGCWPPSQLRELRMNFQASPSIDFVQWLLQDSVLDVLELTRDVSPEVMDFLLDTQGQTLHSLALPACSTAVQVQTVQRCPDLRSLRTDQPRAAAVLFKPGYFPSGLRRIALALDHDGTFLQPLLDVVRLRRGELRASRSGCGMGLNATRTCRRSSWSARIMALSWR